MLGAGATVLSKTHSPSTKGDRNVTIIMYYAGNSSKGAYWGQVLVRILSGKPQNLL